MTGSFHEDGVTPINPEWLQEQAREWAETLAASSKPIVSIDDMYAWGGPTIGPDGTTRDSWVSEPLDIPRELAVEMMRWLAARAAEQARKGGDQ
jgi:hypothetical protein